jgi:hypothetical protein
MSYQDYQSSGYEEECFDEGFEPTSGIPAPCGYIDPYYADEIGRYMRFFPPFFMFLRDIEPDSSPSPPERRASGSSKIPRYGPEEINEYEDDDVPYYEDEPIHYPSTQGHPQRYDVQFGAPRYPSLGKILLWPLSRLNAHVSEAPVPSFRTPSSHVQTPREHAQYQPNFRQQRHENTFRAPAPPFHPLNRGSNPRNSSGIRLRPVSELRELSAS